MKKKGINLLINREDYQKYESYFERLKLSATILTVVLFIIFVYFYFILRMKMNDHDKLIQEKTKYLKMLTSRGADEAKINFIEKKYSDLKRYLKEDASSVTYYELLTQAIKSSSESAQLTTFEVDKTRNTSFIVTFSLFEKMMEFLKFAESEVFLDNFEKISLKNLVIISDDKIANYELGFVGKFIEVKVNIANEK